MQKQELEKQFERHIREHELLIYKVCRIYTYTEADKEDLFQEIVLHTWKAYPSFNSEAKFSTWLYRVAINTAITGLRKKKVHLTNYEPASLPTHESDDDNLQDEEER